MVAQSHAVADDLGADPIVRREPYAMQDPSMRDVPVSRRDSQIRRAPSAAGLYDVLDLILDKGIVIDAFVRVSLVGIELVTVDLRVVIASVDTYLRYAEGVDRLKVRGDERSEPKTLPGMVSGGMKKKALKDGAQSIGRQLFGHDEDEREDNSKHGVIGALGKGVRKAVGRVAGALSGDPSEYEDDEEENDQGGSGGRSGNGHGRHEQERGRDGGRDRDRESRPAKAGAKR
jgi:hypothetical protein